MCEDYRGMENLKLLGKFWTHCSHATKMLFSIKKGFLMTNQRNGNQEVTSPIATLHTEETLSAVSVDNVFQFRCTSLLEDWQGPHMAFMGTQSSLKSIFQKMKDEDFVCPTFDSWDCQQQTKLQLAILLESHKRILLKIWRSKYLLSKQLGRPVFDSTLATWGTSHFHILYYDSETS